MNEQLQNTINSILLSAIEASKQGIEFMQGEIPDLIRQLIRYNLAINSLYLLTAIPLVWLYYKFVQLVKEDADAAIIAIPGGILGVSWAAYLMYCLSEILKLTLAPKIWLLEYAANLVK